MEQKNRDRSTNSTKNPQTLLDSHINNLLQAAADCASALLSDDDFERGVNRALEILGKSVGADRLGIDEHIEDPTGETIGHVVVHPYEWLSPYADSQFAHPEMNIMPYDGIEAFYQRLTVGQYCGGLIETFPEPFRSNQREKLGVKSTYAIPIMVEGKYWGLIGLDFCQTARELSEAEIAVFKTAATCIGSAIQRERNQRAKEEVERNILLEREKAAQEKAIQLQKHNRVLKQRDQILAATAEASNVLLTGEDFDKAVNTALQIIGESIDTDRVGVMEYCDDPSGQSLGYVQALYEWDSVNAISQLNHPEVSRVSFEGIEEWYYRGCKGEWSGGLIDELPEPFRSSMAKIGVKATYSIPIIVESKYWGIIGIDDCQEETHRSEAELSILKTAATCIGSAIQRERNRRAKEEAERQRAVQLEQSNQILSLRDRWLEATANAANQLLATPDLDEGINAALKMLGESLDCDRVCVAQWFEDLTEETCGFIHLLYEWDSQYASRQILNPELHQIVYSKEFKDMVVSLEEGGFVGGVIDEIPDESFRREQIELGVKSTYAVGIFVGGKLWGVLGVDHCREPKRLTLPEIAVFKTAASCVGSAIFRQQIQQQREQAEKTIILEREKAAQEKAAQLEESNQVLSLRDRWLEATANAANQLLATPDLDEGINAALKMLGESLDCDRVAVMKHFEDSTDESLGFLRQLYEWDSIGTISQLLHPQLNEISNDDVEEYFAKLQAGEWLGGLIEEFPEPFRSGQIELGVKSTYAVPIFVDNIYWGALGIDFCRESKRLTPAEIAVFKTAASCVGSAIYRQQIQQQREQAEKTIILEREKAAQEKAAELTKVNAVLSQSLSNLADSTDLDSFLGQVVLEITHQVGAVTGSIFLYDADNHTLQQRLTVRHGIIYHGAAEHDCELFHSPFPADITPAFQHMLETGEIVSINTTDTSDLLWPGTPEWHRRMGHQEAAAIALMIGDKPLGLLGLAFTEKTALKPEELELIYTLTNQASLAIQLTKLAQQAQKSALTDERNRMAREIHDTLAQAFTGISLQLEAARNSLSTQPEAAQERLLRAKMLAKEGINEARRSVRALRPEALESEDLITALHQLVDKMISGTNIKAEISIEGESRSLNPEVEVNLFRIAQEAITNILRHSQANQISIQLIYETDIVHLQIKDNGIGFNPQLLQNQGFGLIGMRERGDRLNGNLVINSASDRGTEIIVTV